MLERCFVRPQTVDRIRSSWLGPPIEQYVTWLLERSYVIRDVLHRVPILMHFGAYAQAQGAAAYTELPAHIQGFVEHWLHRPDDRRAIGPPRPKLAREVRGPNEQMLRLIVPGFVGHTRRRDDGWPFSATVPGFFGYLRDERCGLREETLRHYTHHLRRFEAYLSEIGLTDLRAVSPVVTSAFLTDRSRDLLRTGISDRCGVLRVLLRYLHREGVLDRDLSPTIEAPPCTGLHTSQRYRVVAEVLKGHPVAEVADRVGCHFTVAYDWIGRFNKSGFKTFEQVPNPKGRPPILKAEQLRELVEVALSSPEDRSPSVRAPDGQRRITPPKTRLA
jgi:hypothetical protein